ncbi:Low-density lipoprotein receptor-related protein 4 [Geodia barretti]|uniref:Low-density lipoprotein receptor-related protein 4 n=1 Tax=Geodia barretti TaxID=519541 RepID=A0AA35S150_GEOBA|nr:Low-density lipoprotein receptor-related protein 4 [Geodia barretti]
MFLSPNTGSLRFLTLFSPTTLSPSDDGFSPAINMGSGFRFGPSTVTRVYVSNNGYIFMGTLSIVISPNIPGTSNIVSPYGGDIDTRTTGSVLYTQITTTDSQISSVSSFIRSQTSAGSFFGARMMVAEWNSVPVYSRNSSITSTFQAVLITDGYDSYAVFIYQCGGMGWGGATIGWAYSGSVYEKHSLSGSNSASIGCEYSSNASAVIHKIDSDGCTSSQFVCANGRCVPENVVCNGVNNCGDNSDEERNCGCTKSQFTCANGMCESQDFVCDGFDDCGDNSDEEQDCSSVDVGLAVGLSLGLLFFICILGAIGGFVFYCSRKRQPPQTGAAETTSATGVATTENTPAGSPTYPPRSSPTIYPTQASPVASYPPQPDAQLSYGVPPPSYDVPTSNYYTTGGFPQSGLVAPYPPEEMAPYPPEEMAPYPPEEVAPYPPQHEVAPYPPEPQSPHSGGYPPPSPHQSYPSSPTERARRHGIVPSTVAQQAGYLLS